MNVEICGYVKICFGFNNVSLSAGRFVLNILIYKGFKVDKGKWGKEQTVERSGQKELTVVIAKYCSQTYLLRYILIGYFSREKRHLRF